MGLRALILLVWGWGIFLGHEFMTSSPTYKSEQWAFEAPDILGITVNVLVCLLLAATLESHLRRPSDYLKWSFALFVVLPACAFAATYARVEPAARITAAGMVLLGYLVLAWALRLLPQRGRIPSPTKSQRTYAIGVAVVSLCILGLLVIQLRSSSSLSLEGVYDRRASLAMSGMLPGTGYVMVWGGYVLGPLLLLLALKRRSPILLGVGLALPLAVFALAGVKLAIVLIGFLAVVVVSRWLSLRPGWRNIPAFPILLLCMNGFLLLLARLGIDDVAFVYIARRSVLLPGQITMHYGQWASSRPELGILDPLNSFLGTSGPSVAYEVGELYSRGESVTTNASSSMFSYAFVSGGALAVVVTALIAAALFRFSDILALTRPGVLIVPFTVVTLNLLTESFLHTAIITGGLGLAMVLAWLIPEETGPDERDLTAGTETGLVAAATQRAD